MYETMSVWCSELTLASAQEREVTMQATSAFKQNILPTLPDP